MSEHLIRLRGGWELIDLNGPGEQRVRLCLPTRWAADSPRRFVLSRRFGRPPTQSDCQTLRLRLDHVQGLHAIRLNDRALSVQTSDRDPLEIDLGDLKPRNDLELHVERIGEASRDWGHVCLVIVEDAKSDLGSRPLA